MPLQTHTTILDVFLNSASSLHCIPRRESYLVLMWAGLSSLAIEQDPGEARAPNTTLNMEMSEWLSTAFDGMTLEWVIERAGRRTRMPFGGTRFFQMCELGGRLFAVLNPHAPITMWLCYFHIPLPLKATAFPGASNQTFGSSASSTIYRFPSSISTFTSLSAITITWPFFAFSSKACYLCFYWYYAMLLKAPMWAM